MPPTYTDDEFREALPAPGRETTTAIVAEAVGCTVQTANRRLWALAQEEDPLVEFANPHRFKYQQTIPSSEQRVRVIPEDGQRFYDLKANLGIE